MTNFIHRLRMNCLEKIISECNNDVDVPKWNGDF